METFSTEKRLYIGNQTGDIDLSYTVSFDNVTGEALLGYTDGSDFHYTKFSSGKIFDPDDRFVGSYRRNERIDIRDVVNDNVYDYYLNKNISSTNTPISAHSYSGFFVRPTDCVASLHEFSLAGITGDLTGNTGDIPATELNVEVAINVADSNHPVKIYSAEAVDPYGMIFSGDFPTVVGGEIEGYIITPELVSTPKSVPVVFQTNYGEQKLTFNLTGELQENELWVNTIGFKRNYEVNQTGFYNIISYNNKETYEYRISLEYVDGEASMYGEAYGTGMGTGYLTSAEIGNITGSKIIVHDTISGMIPVETAAGYTGNCLSEGEGYLQVYATGNAVYNYDLQVVGMHGGSPATGMLEGFLTGVVNDGSGFYDFDNFVITGIPSVALTNTGIVIPTSNFTGYINDEKVQATGARPDGNYIGSFLGHCLLYEGEKTFENTWTLESGSISDSGSIRNYYDENWYTGGLSGDPANTGDPKKLYNDPFVTSTLPSGDNAIYAKIVYNNPFTEASLDIARLKIKTPYVEYPEDDYEIRITGDKDKTIINIPILLGGGLLTESGEEILDEEGEVIYV